VRIYDGRKPQKAGKCPDAGRVPDYFCLGTGKDNA